MREDGVGGTSAGTGTVVKVVGTMLDGRGREWASVETRVSEDPAWLLPSLRKFVVEAPVCLRSPRTWAPLQPLPLACMH